MLKSSPESEFVSYTRNGIQLKTERKKKKREIWSLTIIYSDVLLLKAGVTANLPFKCFLEFKRSDILTDTGVFK